MTDAEKIVELEKRLAALEAPPPVAGNLTELVASAVMALGKPDSVVMSAARHALTVGGALIASHGYATNSDTTDLIGAVMVILGMVWAIASKYIATHWLEAAIQAPTTTAVADLGGLAARAVVEPKAAG